MSVPIAKACRISRGQDEHGSFDVLVCQIEDRPERFTSMVPGLHPTNYISGLVADNPMFRYLIKDYFVNGCIRIFSEKGHYIIGWDRITYVENAGISTAERFR